MITARVLVLNRNWQPIQVTTARRAFTLLYQGLAHAIDREYRQFDFTSWAALSASAHDDTVHTVDRVIKVPRVILLLAFDRLPAMRVRFSRFNIYARDEMTCQYCGRRFPRAALNLDHVVPRHRGGATTWENVVCSCVKCNLKKGGRSPEQCGMRLVRKPVRPSWTPLWRLVGEEGHGVRYDDWLPFLNQADISYWNTELVD